MNNKFNLFTFIAIFGAIFVMFSSCNGIQSTSYNGLRSKASKILGKPKKKPKKKKNIVLRAMGTRFSAGISKLLRKFSKPKKVKAVKNEKRRNVSSKKQPAYVMKKSLKSTRSMVDLWLESNTKTMDVVEEEPSFNLINTNEEVEDTPNIELAILEIKKNSRDEEYLALQHRLLGNELTYSSLPKRLPKVEPYTPKEFIIEEPIKLQPKRPTPKVKKKPKRKKRLSIQEMMEKVEREVIAEMENKRKNKSHRRTRSLGGRRLSTSSSKLSNPIGEYSALKPLTEKKMQERIAFRNQILKSQKHRADLALDIKGDKKAIRDRRRLISMAFINSLPSVQRFNASVNNITPKSPKVSPSLMSKYYRETPILVEGKV